MFLILNSAVRVVGVEHPRPSVGPPLVTQPPRGRTKARGCKTGHRIVQAVGQGDPLGWRFDALLWSGFGSPWQRVRSHPGLSKVSARASRAREAAVPFILLQQPLKWGLYFPPRMWRLMWPMQFRNFEGPFLHRKGARSPRTNV